MAGDVLSDNQIRKLIKSGAIVGGTGVQWWHTNFYNGYTIQIQADSTISLVKFVNGSSTNLDTGSVSGIDSYHDYMLFINSNVLLPDLLKIFLKD